MAKEEGQQSPQDMGWGGRGAQGHRRGIAGEWRQPGGSGMFLHRLLHLHVLVFLGVTHEGQTPPNPYILPLRDGLESPVAAR